MLFPYTYLRNMMFRLSEDRPVFHSEDDFKFSLAWKLKEDNKDKLNIRLENPFRETHEEKRKNRFLDIYLESETNKVGIELKYYTSKFQGEVKGEWYDLSDRSAPDTFSYDCIKDITRLENWVREGKIQEGYALWLTNDSYFFKVGNVRELTHHYDFRINQGRKIKSNESLKWKGGPAQSVKKGRERCLEPDYSYLIEWESYGPQLELENRAFKYSLLRVPPSLEPALNEG